MVYIVYPVRGYIDAYQVEKLFVEAVTDSLIPPNALNAKTADEMAAALDNAGVICRTAAPY